MKARLPDGRANPKYHRQYSIERRTRIYEQNKKWRDAHPEKVNEMARRKRALARALTDQMKNRPCADCGKKYPPYVMQFDHVRGRKLFTIGKEPARVSRARLLREIAKCDVVCGNCHAERTHQRRKG